MTKDRLNVKRTIGKIIFVSLVLIVSKGHFGRFVFLEVIVLCCGFSALVMTSKYLGN
jgi:hypothetical protein